MLIIPFFIISIIAITIAMIFRTSFAKVIPSAIFSITIIMYFAGCINNLSFGLYAIYLYCLFSIIYLIYLVIKNDKEKIQNIKEIIISPGFAIFLILYIAIYVYNINASFSFWDEWSHWSVYVKDMFLRNKFYNTPGHIATIHISYPPFIQLFEYFYCKVAGECSMQNLYRSYHILCFSMGLMVFSDLSFDSKNIKNNIKILFVMILSVLYFIFANRIIDFQANPIRSIYGDGFLGLSFGFFIVNVLQYDFDDKFKTFNFILSSIALVFSKQMGTALYLLGFFILFIITVYNRKLCKKVLIKGIVLFLIPILFLISWKIIVFSNHITDQFDLNRKFSITSLIDILFNGGGLDWQRKVITNFINWIFHIRQIGLTIYMWWLLLAIAFVVTSYIVREKYKNKIVITSIGVMIGFLLYLFAIFCLYFFTFSEYEATRLASIWRYSSTYIIGLTFFIGFVLIEYLLYKSKMNIISIIMLIIVVVGLYTSIHFANGVYYNPKSVEQSDDYIYSKDFAYIKDLPAGSRILIVAQGEQGLLYAKFRFKFFDKIFISGSFGKPIYFDNDIWTQNKSKEEMKDYINGFDYIYFYNVDDNFKTAYGDIFKYIPENRSGVYSVKEIIK